MANSITIGRHVVRKEHIAFVEPYDAAANPEFQTSRDFKSRVVMVDPSESRLAEQTPQAFAEANGFRMLEIDGVAVNPAINFRVETFAPQPASRRRGRTRPGSYGATWMARTRASFCSAIPRRFWQSR
jgi:hypothetical protein